MQVFANGNKRTSRLAANLPLLKNNFMPISFVDFDHANYIQGMAAFYEMGATALFAKVFVDGYVRSIVRSSDIPPGLRARGFSIETTVADPLGYVRSGRISNGVSARFINVKPDVD